MSTDQISTAKILVVDDISTMRKIIVCMLEKIGHFEIVEAEDGEPALNIIQRHSDENQAFNLIITDWSMPILNGIDLIKSLRSNPLHSKMKFLITATEKEQENISIALSAGADSFIVKPFNLELLEEKIVTLLKEARLS